MALHVSAKGMSLRAVVASLQIDVGQLDNTLGQGLAEGLQAWEWPPGRWMAHPDEPDGDDVLVARQAGGEGRLPGRPPAQVTPGGEPGPAASIGNERGVTSL